MSEITIGRRRLALVLILVVLSIGAGVVMAATFPGTEEDAWGEYDDLEDGTADTADGWSSGTSVDTKSFDDTYSAFFLHSWHQPFDWSTGTQEIYFRVQSDGTNVGTTKLNDSSTNLKYQSDGQVTYSNSTGTTFNWGFCGDPANTWKDVYIRIEQDNSTEVYVTDAGTGFSDTPCATGKINDSGQTFDAYTADSNSNGNIWTDEIGAFTASLYGTVYDEDWNELEGVTVTVEQNGTTVKTTTTNNVGNYEVTLNPGTYNVTADKAAYIPETEEVDVQGQTVEDFQLFKANNSLELKTHPCLEHGERAQYKVTFVNRTAGQLDTVANVTDDAVVTSNNTSVVTVDTVNYQVQATNDTSVNDVVTLQANYTAPNGDYYEDKYNVTVANHTVKNLGKLCAFERFEASIRDGNILVILIATGVGVAASVIATVFAGVGALSAIMMMGWMMGEVSNPMIIVTVLFGLFLGLNVGLNIDYEVNVRGGR